MSYKLNFNKLEKPYMHISSKFYKTSQQVFERNQKCVMNIVNKDSKYRSQRPNLNKLEPDSL